MAAKVSTGAEYRSESALLIIDMITDFEFEDGAELYKKTRPIVKNIASLKARAKSARVPVVYVNDNFGKWQEDFKQQVESISDSSKECGELIDLLRPDKDDYYVLKPQRSGFYETPLHVLLRSLGVSRLVLAGITTDICILFTAHDAYMRGFDVAVPADCTAAVEDEFKDESLKLMERAVHVDIRPSDEVKFASDQKAHKA